MEIHIAHNFFSSFAHGVASQPVAKCDPSPSRPSSRLKQTTSFPPLTAQALLVDFQLAPKTPFIDPCTKTAQADSGTAKLFVGVVVADTQYSKCPNATLNRPALIIRNS